MIEKLLKVIDCAAFLGFLIFITAINDKSNFIVAGIIAIICGAWILFRCNKWHFEDDN